MSFPHVNECPRCQAGTSPTDRRCPACGTALGGGDSSSHAISLSEEHATGHQNNSLAESEAKPRRALIDNPYAVLAAVFLAMAALGIPLIWACRAWTPFVKVLLTVTTLVYTALIFWGFTIVMLWCWGRISESL